MQLDQPNWRNPAGIGLILLLILLWSIAVVALSELLGEQHWAVWAIFYTVAGIVWVLPLKPLLRWMGTGRWRR